MSQVTLGKLEQVTQVPSDPGTLTQVAVGRP